MATTTFGDLAQSAAFRRHSLALQREITARSAEVTTGRVADPARTQRGDLSTLAAIETSLARMAAFETATAEAETLAASTQRVLETLDTLASDFAPTLLSAGSGGAPGLGTAVAAEARARFDSALSALNTRLGDRTLLAGVETGAPAVADAETILAALDAAVAGAAGVGEVIDRVSDWFDAPSGFAATGYLGGAAATGIAVSADDRVGLAVTAADPAIVATLKGLAIGAMLGRAGVPDQPADRSALTRAAGETLVGAQTDRTTLAARIGTAEGRIAAAATRNAAERSAMELSRAGILGADEYDSATRLERAQTQIETLYAVTARLSRLSLTDFL
jgi:flagellar hook-associated protein 3 FlgL